MQGLTACQTNGSSPKGVIASKIAALSSSDSEPENTSNTSRTVSGSTCVSPDSPTSTKDEGFSGLEVIKYNSRVPARDQQRPASDEITTSSDCKQHRDEILQLQLSHLVEMNDLKALLACREMVHTNELEDLHQVHGSELDRVRQEAQSTTLTTLENAQAFFDQRVKAMEKEHQANLASAHKEYKSALYQSRLSSLETMHKLTNSKKEDERHLEELKLELAKVKLAISDAEAEHATKIGHVYGENEALQVKIDNTIRMYEEKLTLAKENTQSATAKLEKVKEQSQHDLDLAQEETNRLNAAIEDAEERRFRLVKQSIDEKKASEKVQTTLQDKVKAAEQQLEVHVLVSQQESQHLTETVKLVEERSALLDEECQGAKIIIEELRETLHGFEIAQNDSICKLADTETRLKLAEDRNIDLETQYQQDMSNGVEDLQARTLAKDSEIQELTEENATLSAQVVSLQHDKTELTAKADLMEKACLAIQEDDDEEAVGSVATPKGKPQECTICPKKSKNIRQLRRINKTLSTKLTESELIADELDTKYTLLELQNSSDLSKQQATLQKSLEDKEKELIAVRTESEAQLLKFAKWIKGLVVANNKATAQHESNEKMLALKDTKIASMTSDVEQITDLRLRYAALIDSTSENLARKEPDLQVDCRYMIDQINLMSGFTTSMEDVLTEETEKLRLAEKERDEYKEKNHEVIGKCKALREQTENLKHQLKVSQAAREEDEEKHECKKEIKEKTAKVEELQSMVEELMKQAASMEMYTNCYQNLKAALEKNEDDKAKKAVQTARWSKVMLEEIGARFEKKKVQELHKVVTKRVAKLEAEERVKQAKKSV